MSETIAITGKSVKLFKRHHTRQVEGADVDFEEGLLAAARRR
ncbi:MAG: hypothetical protein ACREYE_15925 [Gammaproteobacteria bacterium]